MQAGAVVRLQSAWFHQVHSFPVSPHPTASPTSSAAPPAPGAWAFDAVIFDMDGVVTDTVAVHAQAWKRMFDEFLRQWERERGEPFREFTLAGDYRSFVDGRPRCQGVGAFLESRGIQLPPGSAGDTPDRETICGLGNRKNVLFNRIVETEGVRVFDTTVALIHALLGVGRKVGLATSSRNASLVLGATGLTGLFGTVVDGVVSERLGLKGKPHPDIFVTAAANLGVSPARAIVVEDAVSGVRAGAAGGFGLVVGVAREDNAVQLRAHGADVVVRDLGEISMEAMNQKVRVAPARA